MRHLLEQKEEDEAQNRRREPKRSRFKGKSGKANNDEHGVTRQSSVGVLWTNDGSKRYGHKSLGGGRRGLH